VQISVRLVEGSGDDLIVESRRRLRSVTVEIAVRVGDGAGCSACGRLASEHDGIPVVA
jgi:hypothetical protein